MSKKAKKNQVKMTKEDVEKRIKEALGQGDEDEKEEATAVDLDEIIEQAVADILEKRKAAKGEGDDVTVEEVIEEVYSVLDDLEGKAEPEDEEPEDEPKQKGAPAPSQRKSKPAPAPDRKYAQIFLQRPAATQPETKKIPPAIQLARAIKCLDIYGKHDADRAAHYAKKLYSDDSMAREFKALSVTNPSGGGYLVPEVYLGEVIELLYNKTVLFELGARKVPMPNGNLTMPKMTSGSRAMWGGEQRKISATQPTFGSIKLSAKRLEAIVPQTRELLMSTDFSADQIFAEDLMRRMQLGLDFGGLYGKGTEFEPTGIVNTKGIDTIDIATLGNANLVDASGRITADFPVYVRSRVLSKNVDDMRMGWAFNAMMEGWLMNLKTETGTYIYRDEMSGGKLLGFPYAITNQIATDNQDRTSIFFGNWADLLVGEQMGLETFTTLEGAWVDENGASRSAFNENLSATRALMYVDIAVRHPESFAYIKNAKIA